MKRRPTFLISVMIFGFAFFYIPILSMIVYSFNASRLATVWGGFSLEWYKVMWSNQGLMDAAWVTARVGVLSATQACLEIRQRLWAGDPLRG